MKIANVHRTLPPRSRASKQPPSNLHSGRNYDPPPGPTLEPPLGRFQRPASIRTTLSLNQLLADVVWTLEVGKQFPRARRQVGGNDLGYRVPADNRRGPFHSCEESFNDWGGGRGCHTSVPVLRGDSAKIAPPGDVFDQPSGEIN